MKITESKLVKFACKETPAGRKFIKRSPIVQVAFDNGTHINYCFKNDSFTHHYPSSVVVKRELVRGRWTDVSKVTLVKTKPLGLTMLEEHLKGHPGLFESVLFEVRMTLVA